MEQHARAAKAHHLFHPCPHGRFIAMDGAPLARRFIFPERTAVQTRASIGQEGITRGASPRVSLLHPAVEVDHAPDGSLFPLNSGQFPHFFHIFARQKYENLGYLQKNKAEICLGKEFVCIFVV